MSLIVDANRASDFTHPLKGHAEEILNCVVKKKLRICVGGRLLRELASTKLRVLLAEWSRSGRLERVDDQLVGAEETRIISMSICSDDPHVLGLAIASRCRLLYTEDGLLIKDFKNSALVNPRGKVVAPYTKHKIACSLFNQYGA